MKPLLASLSILVLLAVGAARGDGLRCDGELVSVGDRMFEVRQRCGEPDVQVVQSALHAGYPGYIAYEQQWQYNFGPQRQLRFLDFVNKELRRIRTGPPGFSRPARRCTPNALRSGISQLELLGRCGKPDETAKRVLPRPLRIHPGGVLYPEGVPVTDWIYRFKGNHFIRVVTLIDGWVARIEERDKPD